jgi:hypothetical protein
LGCRLAVCAFLVFLTDVESGSAQPNADAISVEQVAPPTPATPRLTPDQPVEVNVTLTLNKVTNIDTVAETYRVDAYLGARWRDEHAVQLLLRPSQERTLYLDEATLELLGRLVWWPDLELINTVGGREITDRRFEVFGDGMVQYTERFQAELASNMDFRKYPFDSQTFKIQIESYTYRENEMLFADPEARLGHLREMPSPDWQMNEPTSEITRHEYGDGWYSRHTLSIVAERLPGYFVWQVFLPLFLILGTSWIVFWLNEMSDKISVAFTCMLTIVAFNFYTSTLLPQLPYNTFIEAVVISAYVATFLLIGYVLVADRLTAAGKARAAERLLRAGRWHFPLGYCISLALTALFFLR